MKLILAQVCSPPSPELASQAVDKPSPGYNMQKTDPVFSHDVLKVEDIIYFVDEKSILNFFVIFKMNK